MNSSVTPSTLDIAEAKRQLQQLSELHAAGALSPEAHELATRQLERRILDQVLRNATDQVTVETPASRSVVPRSRRLPALLAGLALLLAVGAWGWFRYGSAESARSAASEQKMGSVAPAGGTLGSNPHAQILDQIAQMPEQAAANTSVPGASLASGPTVSGTVSLAPALAGQAKADDTVFIFARPAEGSRMPLAMVRKQVRDLPVQFVLDDSSTMSATSKLSQAGRVIVGARISKGANAVPLKGDLAGQSAPVTVGSKGLLIEIREVVKE